MDDLKKVFDKIEKAEAILNDLDKKREDKVIEKGAYDKLSKEHQVTVDSARQTISTIKEKLAKELAVRTAELDRCQEDLALIETRLKVGEIAEEEYKARSRHLVDKIRDLEKKVLEIQNLINARFAADIAPVLLAEVATPAAESADNKPIGVETRPSPAPKLETASQLTEDKQGKEGHPAEAAAGPAEVKEPEPEEAVEAARPQEAEAQEKEEIPVAAVAGAGNQKAQTPEAETEKEPADIEKKEKTATGVKDDKKAVAIKSHKRSLHLHRINEKVRPKLTSSMLDSIKNNRVLLIAATALVLGLILWGTIAIILPRTGSDIGNVAPDFAMELSDQNTTALSAFKGRNIILVFWDRDFWDNQFFYVNGAVRNLYTPDKLQQLYDQYPRNELSIIAITSGTNNNEVDKLIKDYEIKFPVIVDSFGKLRSSYNVSYEPTYIFLDRNGVIRARVEGPMWNLSDFEQILYGVTHNTSFKQPKPPITDVLIQSITEKSAVINWSTDTPTTTQIDIDGKLIQTVITPSPQTIHSVTLRDLSPDASYRFRIVYNINNINVSEHSFDALADTIVSKRYQVTTSNKDTSYPEITNISTGFITDSSLTVTWKTDEPATGDVDYGTDRNYSETSSQGNTLTIWHTVKLDVLKPDTQYFLRLRSKDGAGKETIQEIESIKTQNSVEIGPVVNKRAPDFTLYSINGIKYTLSQFLGRPILINFWLEGCPACESEMPILQLAYSKYDRSKLIILAVNVRGDPDKVNFFVTKEKLTFPVLLDSAGDADYVYRAPFFPTSYFVDSSGIIRNIVTERFQSINEIDDILNKLD